MGSIYEYVYGGEDSYFESSSLFGNSHPCSEHEDSREHSEEYSELDSEDDSIVPSTNKSVIKQNRDHKLALPDNRAYQSPTSKPWFHIIRQNSQSQPQCHYFACLGSFFAYVPLPHSLDFQPRADLVRMGLYKIKGIQNLGDPKQIDVLANTGRGWTIKCDYAKIAQSFCGKQISIFGHQAIVTSYCCSQCFYFEYRITKVEFDHSFIASTIHKVFPGNNFYFGKVHTSGFRPQRWLVVFRYPVDMKKATIALSYNRNGSPRHLATMYAAPTKIGEQCPGCKRFAKEDHFSTSLTGLCPHNTIFKPTSKTQSYLLDKIPTRACLDPYKLVQSSGKKEFKKWITKSDSSRSDE